VGIFKEAKASYQEKKAAIKAERETQRAQTFDVSHEQRYSYDDYELERHRSYDDVRSHASRRTHGTHRSGSTRHRDHAAVSRSRPALTENNLKTLSEISATAPSRPPVAYRPPYAETAPRDMALSRPTLHRAPTEAVAYAHPRQETGVSRPRSDPSLNDKGKKKVKEIDMNLAYGNIPPDLESRVDLDPAHQADEKEQRAKRLVHKVEGLLDEAHCLQHTATSIIAHLQENPDAAAAVALTLAELSTLLTKMGPGFLAAIKGGSPAVFALLASPQFLIAAGAAVGVTIVMFGGWKIVKRIQQSKAAQADAQAAMAFEAMPGGALHGGMDGPHSSRPVAIDDGVDEALVLEEELSTIESWRRGIMPFGEDDSADIELISPGADRARRRQMDEDDGRTERSAHTHRTSRTQKTAKTHKSHKSRRERDVEAVIPERKSSRGVVDVDAASERSHRTTRTKRTERTTVRAITEKGEDDGSLDLVFRSKEKKNSMLKSIFKRKEKEERATVLA
jgi:hypothetical protein